MKRINMKEILQDKNKTNDFLKANKNLVWNVMYKKFPQLVNTYEVEDYVQEGMMGLYEAMKRFDETKGCEFSTLAYPCIKTAIIRKLQVTDKKIKLYDDNVISIYSVITKHDNSLRIIDMLKDNIDIENGIVDSYDKADRRNKVIQILNSNLSPRRKEIFHHLLLMKSQAQIARDMNCSKEYIRISVKSILKEAAKISA